MIINVDSTGSTINLRYQYASGCQAQSLSMIKSDTADTWYSVTVLGNAITITVSDNSSSETPRSGSVTPYIESIGDICTSNTIEIFQYGNVVCECKDMVIDLFAIPVSGVSANSKIGTYGFYGERCSSLTIEGVIKEIENKTTIATLAFSNGEIFVNSAIPENTSDSFKEFDVEITYDGRPCASYHLSQEGKEVQCDCQHINYFINQRNVHFGLDGSWEQEVLILSADTHGCGSLSAVTEGGTIFLNDNIRVDISDNGHYYQWYSTIKAVSSDTPGTINIYYKNRDESSFEERCSTAITVDCRSDQVFYTCSLISGKQNLLFTNGYYDDVYCIHIENWYVTNSFSTYQNQNVKFVPRLVNDVTEDYLSQAKITYASLPLDSSGVQLNTIIITNTTRHGASTICLEDTDNPLIVIDDTSSARKVYFAVDVYVNDIKCFTREGMYVANESEANLTKCEIIEDYLYKRWSGNTNDIFERSAYEDWRGGHSGENCDVYYNTCGQGRYCMKAAPEVFTYDQTGKDISGDNNWQQIPLSCITYYNSYIEMLSYIIGRTHCIEGRGLSFDGHSVPKIILDKKASEPSYFELESEDSYYTNWTKLISGDTAYTYTKEIVTFDNYTNHNLHFYDVIDDGVFDCNIPISLTIFLRATKQETYQDNLDYSSCSTLMTDLAVLSGDPSSYGEGGGIKLDTTKAKDAWLANGYIKSLTFNYTIPHELVKLENTDSGEIITLNLYWDNQALNASIKSVYSEYYKTIFASYDFDASVIDDAFEALNLCGECESKVYELIAPTSSTVTSFTITTSDYTLTCLVSICATHFSNGTEYNCNNIRYCSDQPMQFNIATHQTYDYNSIVSQGQDIGTFTSISDTQNFRLVGNLASVSIISAFTYNYATGVIHMELDSNYHSGDPAQPPLTTSVIFVKQMRECGTNEWISCNGTGDVSDTIEITFNNVPT